MLHGLSVDGDPLVDIAKAYCYSRRRGPELLDALAAGNAGLRRDWRDAVELYELHHWLELREWLATTRPADPLEGIAAELRRICA